MRGGAVAPFVTAQTWSLYLSRKLVGLLRISVTYLSHPGAWLGPRAATDLVISARATPVGRRREGLRLAIEIKTLPPSLAFYACRSPPTPAASTMPRLDAAASFMHSYHRSRFRFRLT